MSRLQKRDEWCEMIADHLMRMQAVEKTVLREWFKDWLMQAWEEGRDEEIDARLANIKENRTDF